MNGLGLGGGMKRGSGRGRLLDFLPSSSPSPFCWSGKGGRVLSLEESDVVFFLSF